MPRPSRRLLLILLFGTVPAAFIGLSPVFATLTVVLDLSVIICVLVDAWLANGGKGVLVRRSMPTRVSRRKSFALKLELHNSTNRELLVNVIDRLPESFEPRERRLFIRLGAGQRIEREDNVVATSRGNYEVREPVAECMTPFGLGVVRLKTEGGGTVRVLPDTRALGQFDALVRQRRLHEMGVARVRERGEGTEIAGLRPYSLGDPYARIDWKATARRAALVTRESHAERRQNVVLLLDCGRRMAREADGRSRLDYAVEAALLLSHVALRSDDRVGLAAFADRILRIVQPVRGYASASVLADAIFALQPILREPPYEMLAASVSGHFRRRSLIIFFTDAAEPASLQSLARAVRFLGQRHLVVCVVFQDAAVERALAETPADLSGLFRAGAASELALDRDCGLRQLKQAGALLVEAPAAELSTRVINRYLEVKARRLL